MEELQKVLQQGTGSNILALEAARKIRFGYKQRDPVKPVLLGIKEFQDIELGKVIEYIDWSPFFHGWGLKGKYPGIFNHDRMGIEAKRLYDEARDLLDTFQKEHLIRPKAVIGLFPANSLDDDILVYSDDRRKDVVMKIPMLRQQRIRRNQRYTLSLADYVAPVNSGLKDYFGGFAATTGTEIEPLLLNLKKNGDGYDSVLYRLIADRLVEATAELIHEWVRKKYWGYASDENLSMEERIRGKYKGIRPAVGYPACPDHGIERYLFDLLQVKKRIGISLTRSYAMKPASSVTGFYFPHAYAKYFGIRKIGNDQLHDYARRTGQKVSSVRKRLYFALDEQN